MAGLHLSLIGPKTRPNNVLAPGLEPPSLDPASHPSVHLACGAVVVAVERRAIPGLTSVKWSSTGVACGGAILVVDLFRRLVDGLVLDDGFRLGLVLRRRFRVRLIDLLFLNGRLGTALTGGYLDGGSRVARVSVVAAEDGVSATTAQDADDGNAGKAKQGIGLLPSHRVSLDRVMQRHEWSIGRALLGCPAVHHSGVTARRDLR